MRYRQCCDLRPGIFGVTADQSAVFRAVSWAVQYLCTLVLGPCGGGAYVVEYSDGGGGDGRSRRRGTEMAST